jgi:uncharacterized protein involved in exopolysaccharide biosynthesis
MLEEAAEAETARHDFYPGDRASQPVMVARFRLLWNRRRLLFRASASGLLVFTLIAFLIPKQYESTVLLMPPDDQSTSGLMLASAMAGKISGSLAGVAGDLLGLKSSGDLFIGILRSRTIQDELIKKLDLMKAYKTKEWEPTRRILTANTAIYQDRKSGIITITVTDKSPQRAAALAGEYVTQLNAVVSQLSTSSARRERVFLEERLAQVKQDLEIAEKDFSEFASKNGTVDIKEQGRAMVEGAASIEGQLIAAQSEMQGLKQVYSENNVRVRAVKARIAELQDQLQQLGGKKEIAGEAMNSKSDDLYPSIRKLPLLGVPYADLYRRTRVEEAVFESLTQEYELAKVAEAKEIPSVKVLDPPNVPERKSFPPRLAIMFLGTFLCCAGSVVWLLGKARWDEIPDEDAQKIFAQDVLRTINAKMPWAIPNGSRVRAMSHRIWNRVARQQHSANGRAPEHSESELVK